MKKLIIALSLLPVVSGAFVLDTDPIIDTRVTHCALYDNWKKVQIDPLFVGASGNICHFEVDPSLLTLGLHPYTASVEVIDINGKVTSEPVKSNRVWYNSKPLAPTGLKVTQ